MVSAQGRTNYRDTASRIKNIVKDYGGHNFSDYLKGIAHKVQF